jgi:hypothetical protein
VLLFFATSILLTDPPENAQPDLASFFVALGRRFFLMFALLQAWIVVVGYTMAGSLIVSDMVNIGMFVLAISLAFSTSERFQNLGVYLAWGLGLASVAVRWLVQ